jgi:hypothetical protein
LKKNLNNKIADRHRSILSSIQQKYNLSGDDLKFIQQAQNQKIKYSNSENILPIQHDKNIPPFLMHIFKNSLKKNGISPKIMNIICNDNHNKEILPLFRSHIENNVIHIEIIAPGCTVITKNWIEKNSEASCVTTAYLLRYTIDAKIMLHIIRAITQQNINDDNLYNNLNSTINLSLLNHALNNKYDAALFQEHYTSTLNLFFSNDDFKDLCKINALHRMRELLEKYS